MGETSQQELGQVTGVGGEFWGCFPLSSQVAQPDYPSFLVSLDTAKTGNPIWEFRQCLREVLTEEASH